MAETQQPLIAAALAVRGLEPVAKLLLVEVASRADSNGLCAVLPGSLANAIGADKKAVQAALVQLRVAKHVTLGGSIPGAVVVLLVHPGDGQ